ncbi:MAG: NnrS family protein [Hyphomicrobiaceae bacterium]
MTSPAASSRVRMRPPILFSAGFRFFFLAGPIFAVLAMAIWIGWLAMHASGAALTSVPFSVPPHEWHAHEMIYGYAAAVIAGFFLTAVPNWTGSEPARANFILVSAIFWLVGRLALLFSSQLPAVLVMSLDLLFVPVLALKILGNLIASPKRQNMVFLALLALLTTGNAVVHLGWAGLISEGASHGIRIGLLTLTALITMLGGRVTPGFTRNALMRGGNQARLPVSNDLADKASLASVLSLPAAVAFAPDILLGLLSAIAGLANLIRLAGWRSHDVLDQPILWSLHLGFLMLGLGYLLLAAHWWGAPIGEASALHLLAIGAVGVMTLAVMSRAALGHTGRPLVVARPIAVSYLMVALAALMRSLGLLLAPAHYYAVVFASGALWIFAFALFVIVYAPILLADRADRVD